MASIYDWDVVAANNATADADLTWAEGQAPSTVNDSARVMMQRGKEMLVDLGGSLTAGGTANALTLTAQSGFTTLANGRIISFKAASTNTAAATINVNSIGAKAIRKMTDSGDTALVGSEIQAAGMYTAQYSTALNGGAGAFLLLNPTQAIPAGSVMDYAGTAAPNGWLLCFGQEVSRTTYAVLFAAIGTTYGAGNGSTTFDLPDLRGRVVAGQDDMGGTSANRLTGTSGSVNGDTLGGSGGTETHTLTDAQMPSHNHTGTTSSNGAHAHTFALGALALVSAGGSGAFAGGGSAGTSNMDAAGVHTHTFTTSTSGSDGAHNNVQPTFILNKIIKI